MWQVQETTLDWLVGLAAATALHLGPAILPLKGQITRVLKALYNAPSKVRDPCVKRCDINKLVKSVVIGDNAFSKGISSLDTFSRTHFRRLLIVSSSILVREPCAHFLFSLFPAEPVGALLCTGPALLLIVPVTRSCCLTLGSIDLVLRCFDI